MQINSVDDFMVIQTDWGLWDIRVFWLVLFGGLLALIVNAVTG
jgi:hypothetical protein